MSIQTPSKPSSVRRAERAGEKVEHTTGFEALARAGFVARGVIYGVIGILAVKLAIGAGGKTTSQSGALKTIAQQPFGEVLLILVAIGLAGGSLAPCSVTDRRTPTVASSGLRPSAAASRTR